MYLEMLLDEMTRHPNVNIKLKVYVKNNLRYYFAPNLKYIFSHCFQTPLNETNESRQPFKQYHSKSFKYQANIA